MLRLTRVRKYRVSNRMAALAAFLLVAATAAGVSSPLASGGDAGGNMMAASQETETQPAAKDLVSIRKNKGFKVNLYLFRRN